MRMPATFPGTLPTVLAASFVVGAVPATAAIDTGVPAYDRSTRILYVNNVEYYVPPSVRTIRLWHADAVTVRWELEGGRRVIKSFSAQHDDENH